MKLKGGRAASGLSGFANGSVLTLAAVIIAVFIAAPVLSVFSNVFVGGTGDTWAHLSDTVLGDFVLGPAGLMDDVAGSDMKAPPGLGERHTGGLAHEQRAPQLLL